MESGWSRFHEFHVPPTFATPRERLASLRKFRERTFEEIIHVLDVSGEEIKLVLEDVHVESKDIFKTSFPLRNQVQLFFH